jgi:hypothetical protein
VKVRIKAKDAEIYFEYENKETSDDIKTTLERIEHNIEEGKLTNFRYVFAV